MAFHNNSKCPLKRPLSDAIKLLREITTENKDRLREAPENHFSGASCFFNGGKLTNQSLSVVFVGNVGDTPIIKAAYSCGLSRSSDEVPVMGMERRA